MKHLSKILLTLAGVGGISFLVAQEVVDPKDTKPAPAQPTPAQSAAALPRSTAGATAPARYEYRIVSVPIPDISTSGHLPSLGNPLSALTDFEIVDVTKVQSVMRTPVGTPETKRDVLIYTLRKLRH